jgi:cytoskeletal protein RodZ
VKRLVMPIDLEKIGKILKEKRELQGLTLVDVSNSLCIRKSLVGAMESGSWELLPHEVYVRGYLKEYAHLLNVYAEITDDIVQKEALRAVIEIPVRQKTELKGRQIPKRVFVYPLVFVLVIGFFILSQINKEQNNTAQKIQYAESTSKNVDSSTSDMKNATDVSDAKKLMITCQERTWVSVVIDDTEKKEFMLNPQDIIILNAKEKYDLLIGNAAGVKLILDGNDIQLTGISGEVKRIKLS